MSSVAGASRAARVRRWSPEEIRRRAEALGPWFHNLDLHGVRTAPEHFLGDYPQVKFDGFARALPSDLTGRSVLDIGCNGGFYSMEMKRRGADRVLGIDCDDAYLTQARFAAEVSGHDIEFRNLSVYDVAALGERFDLVIFMGVFYHLRHPLLALDLIHAHVARDLLLFQSMQRGSDAIAAVGADYPILERKIFNRPGWPKLHFIEHQYSQLRLRHRRPPRRGGLPLPPARNGQGQPARGLSREGVSVGPCACFRRAPVRRCSA